MASKESESGPHVPKLELGGDERASERQVLLFRAKLYEQTERYDSMLLTAFQLADAVTGEMSTEEQHVVTVAFKNAVSPLRTSWRILSAKEGRDHESKMEFRNEEVVPELKALLHRILACVRRLHKTASSPQASAFLLKLEGDYLRYMLELDEREVDPVMDDAAALAVERYTQAQEICKRSLAPTHPLRLGLALNFAVFYFDMCKNPERAIFIAKTAFDGAVADLNTLDEATYRDATLILQLIRDNITLWTSAMADSGDES